MSKKQKQSSSGADSPKQPSESRSDEVTLAACPIGLFMSADNELCLKTECGDNEGRVDAYIVSSGEFFWGGTKAQAEQRKLLVRPVTSPILALGRREAVDEALSLSVHWLSHLREHVSPADKLARFDDAMAAIRVGLAAHRSDARIGVERNESLHSDNVEAKIKALAANLSSPPPDLIGTGRADKYAKARLRELAALVLSENGAVPQDACANNPHANPGKGNRRAP